MDATDSKTRFINIYNGLIKREGADKLLDYLTNSCDFFSAPASSKFHLACEGGLCEHSINVYNRLLNFIKNEYGENYREQFPDESIAICGLLHDVCKTDFYTTSYRNVKNDFGVWEKVPFYSIDEKLPYGHGEKSVYIISGFMRLNRAEALAINWHMGGFDDRVRGGNYSSVGTTFDNYPLAMFLHIADMTAAHLDENK